MHQHFEKIYKLLEDDRSALIAKLRALTDEQRRVQHNGKWSIDQIVAHLLTAERLSLVYMRKKSRGVDQLGNSGIPEALKMMLLKISQRVPVFKFTAPKHLVEATPSEIAFEELVSKWDDFRNQLKKFSEAIPDKNVRKKIYKHDIAGRLDAAQAVAFLRAHFHHHLPQINTIIKRTENVQG